MNLTLTMLVIALTFVAGGFVKGIVGMGLPTLAMGLLSLVMPPVQAATLLVVPSLVTNVWQLVAGPSLAGLLKRFATMMLGVCVGTALGIGLLTGGANALAAALLGVVLAIYAVLGLVSRRFAVSPSSERWLSPLIGLITGFLSGATGVFVIPAVPYLNSLQLEKDDLIQALGISFTVSTLALATGLALSGRFDAAVAGHSLLALLCAIGGMLLGQQARSRLHPQAFRRWFLIGMLLLGIYMVVRASIDAFA